MNSTLESALHWLSIGAALVPLQPNSKYHVAGFGAYLKKITDEKAAGYWFDERRCNLGVVCAGDLVCLDFDTQSDYDHVGAQIESLTEKTKRGYHVFGRAHGVRSVRAAAVEVKAGGAVVTVAPSVVGGVRYAVVKPLAIKQIDLAALLPGLSFLSESQQTYAHGGSGDDSIARCKNVLDILQVAQALQKARGLPELRERVGRPDWWRGLCPFHGEKNASYFVNVTKGFYLCRSCGARGDVLNLYQVLHGLPDVVSVVREVLVTLGK